MSTAGSVTISYTTLAEVALVAALVGGIAYIGSSKSHNQPHPTSSSLAPQPPSAGAKKSNKKKKNATKNSVAPAAAVEPVVEAATAVKDHVVAGASAAVQRAQPAVQEAVAQVKQASAQVATQVQEVASGATAKKSGGGKKANKKGGASPKPDATKHAEQKVVLEQSDRADMVDPKDHPQVARVMKVVGGKVGAAPPPPPAPAQDGEWESLEDDEGGWESVVSKSGWLFPRSVSLPADFVTLPRTLAAVYPLPQRERLVRRRVASRPGLAHGPDDQEAARERCEKGQGAVGQGCREPRAGGATEAVPSRARAGSVRSVSEFQVLLGYGC